MANYSLLLEDLPNGVARGVIEHLAVYVLIAVILVLVAFVTERLFSLSTFFVPIKVQGKWSTSLSASTTGTPAGTVAEATPHGEKTHEYVKLHQFFNRVWGDAFVQNEPKDVYRVNGRIVADKLALIFRDKQGFDTGAVLLRVANKDLMQGYEVGVDSTTNFYSRVYTWRREVDRFAPPSSGGGH